MSDGYSKWKEKLEDEAHWKAVEEEKVKTSKSPIYMFKRFINNLFKKVK